MQMPAVRMVAEGVLHLTVVVASDWTTATPA